MHELSLMADLFRKISSVVEENGARRVASVKVRLGALSHISPEHFREHFQHAATGTPAEGARLIIETSDDITAPGAQDILLENIEIEAPE